MQSDSPKKDWTLIISIVAIAIVISFIILWPIFSIGYHVKKANDAINEGLQSIDSFEREHPELVLDRDTNYMRINDSVYLHIPDSTLLIRKPHH